MLKVFLAVGFIAASFQTLAAPPSDGGRADKARSEAAGPGARGAGNPVCAAIRDACEKAGLSAKGTSAEKKSRSGSGYIKDCMIKWSSGSSIPGFSIKATDEAGKACAEHITRMKDRRSRLDRRRNDREDRNAGPSDTPTNSGQVGLGSSASASKPKSPAPSK